MLPISCFRPPTSSGQQERVNGGSLLTGLTCVPELFVTPEHFFGRFREYSERALLPIPTDKCHFSSHECKRLIEHDDHPNKHRRISPNNKARMTIYAFRKTLMTSSKVMENDEVHLISRAAGSTWAFII